MSNKITTQKYEDYIYKVYVDDRENERVEYAEKQYSAFNPMKCHLDIGDYIFQSYDKEYVVFEYKTAHDFLSSIGSNHLSNQVYHMVTNFDYSFVIVQAEDLQRTIDELYHSTGVSMSLSQVNGAIAEYSTSSTVLFVQTQYQAFDLMMRVAGKIFMNKPLRYKYGKKTTNFALNTLSAIRGIDNKSEVICRQLHLKTLNDLLNLTIEDLTMVNGIGEKTAEKIIKQIKG